MKLKHLFICILSLSVLTGCSTSKKKAYQTRMAQEIAVINQHFYSSDISALIYDYRIYPENRNTIYGYLFYDMDYSTYTYNELDQFVRWCYFDSDLESAFTEIIVEREKEIINEHFANNDVKSLINDYKTYFRSSEYTYDILDDVNYSNFCYNELVSFLNQSDGLAINDIIDSVISERQNGIIKELSTKDIKDVAEYYKKNIDQNDFLNEYIASNYVNVLDSIEYFEIKELEFFFSETPFHTTFSTKRTQLKEQLAEQIKQDQKRIVKTELEQLDYFEYSLDAELTEYLENQCNAIVTKLIDNPYMEKMKKKEVKKFVLGTINDKISEKSISDICKVQSQNYAENINEIRISIINDVAFPMTDSLFVATVLKTSTSNHFEFDEKIANKLIDRSQIPQFIWDIISNFPGFPLVADVVIWVASPFVDDLISNLEKDEEKFKECLVDEISAYRDEIINTARKDFENNIKTTQEKFLSLYYELY